MSTAPLFLPRRLAIALLAAAQRDPKVAGVIGARAGEPASVRPGGGDRELAGAGEELWAAFTADADAPALALGRQLRMSVDLKGVLQLRCLEDGAERELKIRD